MCWGCTYIGRDLEKKIRRFLLDPKQTNRLSKSSQADVHRLSESSQAAANLAIYKRFRHTSTTRCPDSWLRNTHGMSILTVCWYTKPRKHKNKDKYKIIIPFQAIVQLKTKIDIKGICEVYLLQVSVVYNKIKLYFMNTVISTYNKHVTTTEPDKHSWKPQWNIL